METTVARTQEEASAALGRGGILRQSLRFYRSHFRVFVGTFLVPATAHFVWIELQRLLNHWRHPDWPQEGIIFRPDLGSSIYFMSLVLTCAGALVYLAFSGPAIAAASDAVSALSDPGSAQAARAAVRRPWFRALNVQLLATLLAWWPFLAALAGAVVVGFTILSSAGDLGIGLWYLLLIVAFFVGVPAGIWMSARSVLAVPAALHEFRRAGASIKRGVRLTKGIRLRILAVLGLAAGLRWILGFAANVLLGAFARAHPATSTVEAFVLIPSWSFALDLGAGPLFGIPIALFYRRQAHEPVAAAVPVQNSPVQ
ncbi:MAG: hypothetical protein ABSF23_02725 [Terracidiphilus sp.]|jgi:hypothetical protein